ncbi:hypothetical protein B0I73DRAFT_142709 [Yarrowia lipolytica]|nr:hypothetical protein B0I73DRAFT_142709 [Yarrowia lipolytica]
MAVICHEHSEVKFSVETSQTDDSVIDVSFSNVNALFWDRDHETSKECEKDDGESSMDPDMVSIDKTSFKLLPPLWLVCSEDETEMWKFGNKKLGPGKPDFDLTSVFECADEDDSDVVLE